MAIPSVALPPPDITPTPSRGWVAIWQSGQDVICPPTRPECMPRAEMTLCLEFTVPQSSAPPRPKRVWQGVAETSRAIAVYAMPDGALRLVHGEIDLTTPPDFGRAGETLSLRYRTCARGRGDMFDLTNHDRALRHRGRAGLACAARLDEALPRESAFLHICTVAAVADFGLAPTDIPALAAGAIVTTTLGPRPVETLQPGVGLVTVGGARPPLRWIERRPRLCLGRSAPILLRAPYFGLEKDICVTPETRVARSGPMVEYLFGVEHVLVRAGDMIASPGAQRDRTTAMRYFYPLMFDDHACVAVDRCGVESALLSDVIAAADAGGRRQLADADRTPCLPVLDRAGAQALVAASVKGRRSLS